ncbi:MAG: hypothetical protein M3Q30_15410 [Actinomycetota bacterium]|nr:hypothetical protein [Actinomycetota bacterium]
MSRDEAAQLADDCLREFVASMAAAGNPGSGRHEIGLHHVRGWILEYDGTIGGSEIQAVIGIDGVIHARREPRSLRTHNWSASEWVLRDAVDPDPMAAAKGFAQRLSRMVAFDVVGNDARRGEESQWVLHSTDEDSHPSITADLVAEGGGPT